jgi:hypothetical protein
MTKPPREIYVVKPEDGQVGLWASETRILEGMIEYVEKSAYTALELKLKKAIAALEEVDLVDRYKGYPTGIEWIAMIVMVGKALKELKNG